MMDRLLAGLDRAFIDFKVYCCHSDIDFTLHYILTNLNPKSVSGENFVAIGQG